MIPHFSPAITIGVTAILALFYFIFKFYIRPYFTLLYYKRQGCETLFHKELIAYIPNLKQLYKTGDFFTTYRAIFQRNPKVKAIAQNSSTRATLLLVDPEMMKEFFRRYEVYQKDQNLFKPFIETAQGSIVFAEGAVWKKKRKLISSAFNFEFLKDIVPMIIETTQANFNQWIESGNLKDMNLCENLGMITGEVTGRFFFGKTFGDQKLRGLPITTFVQQFLNNTIQELLSLTTILFGTKFMKANILPRHKRLNEDSAMLKTRCREMIEETEKSAKKEKNLLTHLLELRTSGKEEDRLTNEEIVGEFIGIFAAGTDTTSHLVNSAIYFLWKNPEVYAKVKEEVDREFADPSQVNIESVNKMEYTAAFLKETLRLGGPVSGIFDREVTRDDDLLGLKLRKGDAVTILSDLYFRSDAYYSKPLEIHPERWLNDPAFSQDGFKSESYAFIPFSAGPRNCVGQHLGMIEAKIIIALFVKTFKFSFPEDYKFVLIPRFTYEPFEPLIVTLEPKNVA